MIKGLAFWACVGGNDVGASNDRSHSRLSTIPRSHLVDLVVQLTHDRENQVDNDVK